MTLEDSRGAFKVSGMLEFKQPSGYPEHAMLCQDDGDKVFVSYSALRVLEALALEADRVREIELTLNGMIAARYRRVQADESFEVAIEALRNG